MKKHEQELINNEIMNALDEYNADTSCGYNEKRLRNCTAWVYEKGKYYYLRSYGTIIAFIDKETDTLYDVLRYVYGYTSTSAQHISKFAKDYGRGKWGCSRELRYYPI